MSNRVLITGAAGFIGSHLVEAVVSQGHEVRALPHYNFQSNWGWLDSLPKHILAQVEFVPIDICDPFAVHAAMKGCNAIYHLASLIAIPYSYRAPSSYVDTNIKGTLNVLQAAVAHDVDRVIHTSTSEAYGTAQYVPIDELHPLVAQSPYSASKIAADKLAESYHRSFGLPVSTIRPFNTFGPRQSARAVVPTIISQILAGVDPIKLGALHPIRDLNYVADTVTGFQAVADSDKAIGCVTNIGTGSGVSIGDLTTTILKLCDSSATIETDDQRLRPVDSEVDRLVCDNRKAKERLGWSPHYSLEDGLRETIDWMTNHMEYYRPSSYTL